MFGLKLAPLLLQRFGACRNHHATFGKQRRHQIGKRFPRAGPGLHDQLPAFRQSVFDGQRHLHLSRPGLERRVRRSQRAARQEEAFDLPHRVRDRPLARRYSRPRPHHCYHDS